MDAPRLSSNTPLMIATSSRCEMIVELLLRHGANPNVVDNYDNTALIDAIRSGSARVVELLLIHGANPNAANNDWFTPLQLAAYNGSIENVDLLLKYGANPNFTDIYGDTPLIEAAGDGSAEIIVLLLDHGADPNVANSKGISPLELASQTGRDDVVSLLRARASRKNGLPIVDMSPQSPKPPLHDMKRDLGLWFKLFLFRFLVALCTLSAGHPDELWQFHEPAHAVVFNRGHLSWDWRARIRSFVFPLPLIFAFYVAKLAGQAGFKDLEDFIVQMAPLVIRAFWASTADLYTVKLARRFFGPLSAKWALLFTLSSRAQAHMGTRAYSNAVETALCAVVAYTWPTNRREWSRRKWASALAVLGLTCLVRVSAVQMFLPAALLVFFYAPNPLEVILIAVPLVALIVSIGVAIDSYFYGQLTISWWNFFQWNVVQNVSTFFGTSPFYFYFSSLGKELLRTALPFTLFGLINSLFTRKSMFPFLVLILPYFTFSSIQPHKEDRFILPILPLLLVYSAHGGQQIEVWLAKKHRYLKYTAKVLLMAMVAYNSWDITRELNLKFVAPWNAMQDLRNRVKSMSSTASSSEGILLLANCHNFPHYGVFHYDYPLTFISCPPHFYHEPFKTDADHEIQSKLGFYQYLEQYDEALEYFMNYSEKPPKYVAMFGHTYLGKADAIKSLGYKECGRHVSFILDQLQGKDSSLNDVFILCHEQE